MEQDASLHADDWYFPNLAIRLDASIPYRFIGGARDITTPPQQHILPLLNRLQELGADARYTEFDDGHAFPISRVRLARTILGWLSEMEAGQNK